MWPFLSRLDSSACPWDFGTVEEVGMSLTDTSGSRLTNQVLQDMNA